MLELFVKDHVTLKTGVMVAVNSALPLQAYILYIIYCFIYIYMCVCVCVCVCFNAFIHSFLSLIYSFSLLFTYVFKFYFIFILNFKRFEQYYSFYRIA